jgi:ubiquinone/menaquinone biosynthesis C-methylase UbiE
LGFKDESFHFAVDIVSLAHNENPQDIVREIHRVLKPDGKLFSVIPTNKTHREPFEKYGAIQFLDHTEVFDLFAQWFTLSVGWVKELTHQGKLLDHWIISATKS